ncbi:hypothetical protein NDU88_007698 [Pleurodeles waltl]|uniref:Uncharacterized protein n=1 Tax=Pleurodeles waltl TaxID=8319 RepID=A0AAV7PM24_PLEWA|nr:hypothetical protein NDU88_007698 [Pleurodeles waltl]
MAAPAMVFIGVDAMNKMEESTRLRKDSYVKDAGTGDAAVLREGFEVGPLIPADVKSGGVTMLRGTSWGCNDIKGPQVLQWHQIIMDLGLMTLRCQRSWAG